MVAADIVRSRIWYNYILTVLFSTLIDSRVDLRDGITPETVVIQASETIIFLARAYQDKCGFVAVHPFLPHMVFAATLVHSRRQLDDDLGPHKTETAVKRKSKHTSPRRSTLPVLEVDEATYPPWRQHITPTTLRQTSVAATTDIKSESSGGSSPSTYVWPRKSSSDLAFEGMLYLTKMGITNRKASDLAKALRPRANATTAVFPAATGQGGPLWATPGGWEPAAADGWDAGGEGAGGGIGCAGFGGLGVDSLQGFAALTNTSGGLDCVAGTGQDEREYNIGDVPCVIGGQAGLQRGMRDVGGSSYEGLYMYPGSLPQMGGGCPFGGFAAGMMDGGGAAGCGGGMSEQEGGIG